MISKILRVFINSIRFVGKPCYRRLLAVDQSTHIEVDPVARLSVGLGFRTRRNVEMNVRDKGFLVIGDNVFFNTGCIITVRDQVSIGEGTIFGPYVQIFDHDHQRINGYIQDNQYKTTPIDIGKNCWIGAGSIILRGTVLGDNCVVGAGAVVKGQYPDGSIIIQKR